MGKAEVPAIKPAMTMNATPAVSLIGASPMMIFKSEELARDSAELFIDVYIMSSYCQHIRQRHLISSQIAAPRASESGAVADA
jgi:hypothetical protein